MSGKGGYIALAMCMVVAGIITLLVMESPRANTAQEPTQTETPAVQEDPMPAAPVIEPEEVEDLPRPVEILPEETEPAAPNKPAEEIPSPEELVPQVVSPLDGTTVTVFSMTELMYDETMADWRTHSGVDIQAGEGDAVKTAADGTVLTVAEDELMGYTVVIEHAGGYTTQYSSLTEDPPVEAGQPVSAGQIIGFVGNTAAAESTMGPHLHFSVSLDGEPVDPQEYVG